MYPGVCACRRKTVGSGSVGQSVVTDIADDPDDFGKGLIRALHENPVAHRVAFREVTSRERVVHDEHPRAAQSIVCIEDAPVDERNAHRREIAAAHQRAISRKRARRVADGLALDPEAGPAIASGERQELDRASGLDAWNRFDTLEDLIDQRDPRLGRPHAEEQIHRDGLGGLEAESHAIEAVERPEQQARAHEEHDGEGDFGDDEQAADPVMAAVGRPASRAAL